MSEIENLLKNIKDCWPQFSLTKEDLLRPTPELVFRFYSYFIEDYNERITYLTNVPAPVDLNMEADHEPEHQLFVKLFNLINNISGLELTLSDIYQPTALRTKNFFKLCIHFIVFIETVQNQTESLGGNVFECKEETAKLEVEQQSLIDEINEKAKSKAELIENKRLLEQEHNSTKNAHKEMKALQASKTKLYAEKRIEIENLKHKLENMERELEVIENVEKSLLEQRITEMEYQNILHSIEMLKNESETLNSDDVDIAEGLVHENKVLQHITDCNEIFNKGGFNMDKIENLIRMEDELKINSGVVDKLISTKLNPIKQQKLEHEQVLMNLEEEYSNKQIEKRNIQNSYENAVILFARESNELKNDLSDKFKKNTVIAAQYEKDIEKLEEDREKLRKCCATEYIRVSSKEKEVVDAFKNNLMKFRELENGE